MQGFLEEVLRSRGYTCYLASDGQEALELFRIQRPALTIADVRLSGLGGAGFFKAARALDANATIIVMTDGRAMRVAVEWLQRGADELLRKRVNAAELVIIVKRAVERRRLLIAGRVYQSRVERQIEAATKRSGSAQYDQQTGFPNRSLFQDRLIGAMARACRNKQRVAVMFLGFDGLTCLSDGVGEAGSVLLAALADGLKQCLREMDAMCRWGEEEFAVILEQLLTADDAATVAQRVVERLRPPFLVDGREVSIPINIGIAIHSGDTGSREMLTHRACFALHAARQRGANGCEMYGGETAARVCRSVAEQIRRGDVC